jgi:hypothetical protein
MAVIVVSCSCTFSCKAVGGENQERDGESSEMDRRED